MEVKNYANTEKPYKGVSSTYSARVMNQNANQPRYCEPGEATGQMKGAKRNTQEGPTV